MDMDVNTPVPVATAVAPAAPFLLMSVPAPVAVPPSPVVTTVVPASPVPSLHAGAPSAVVSPSPLVRPPAAVNSGSASPALLVIIEVASSNAILFSAAALHATFLSLFQTATVARGVSLSFLCRMLQWWCCFRL